MGFWGNLFFQNGMGKAIDPFELTPLGSDEETNLAGLKIPEFEEDPDYRETQDYLKTLGIDMLGGKIPDYYKSIGETGGEEFENYLSLLKGDVGKSVEDSAAATGRSGGVVASQTAEQVGRLSTEARFNDYMRALEGKQYLFGQGKDITEGVRASGQAQQGQKNLFNLDAAGLDMKKRLGLDEQDMAEGESMGKLFEMGLGAAAGFITSGGNPVGALVGATGGFDYSSLLEGKKKTDTPVGTDKKAKLDLGTIKPYKSLKGAVA